MAYLRLLCAMVLAAVVTGPFAMARAAPNGAQIYQRCAACHLGTGAGVPDAFPPLGSDVVALAARAEGRRYLALVLIKGIAGPVVIEGHAFRGAMPAQGLDDASAAAVLNHVIRNVIKNTSLKPFTAVEIAAVRRSATGLRPVDIARMHADLSSKR